MHEAMKFSKGSLEDLPLMAEEEVWMSFGERHGLEAEAEIDHNTIVLTDRRLIRLSGAGTNWDVAFISLGDAQVAEVRLTSRGKKPLLRVALLLAGAAAALLTIDYPPLALPLAAVLGLAGGYHLYRYLSISQIGSIHFRTGQEEVEIPFQGDMADQAYAFVNRFFQLKASSSPSPAPEVGEGERMWLEALHEQAWRETDEVETGPVIDQGDGSPVETREEGILQEEPARNLDEEDEQGVPCTHI